MCTALKVFLASPRGLKSIYILLFLPPEADAGYETQRENNEKYVKEAERILGTPHDAALYGLQARDFGAREAEIKEIESAVGDGRRVLVLGSPNMGKTALLEHLFYRAHDPDAERLFRDWQVGKVSFGRLHKNTAEDFVYRKFLLSLEAIEEEDKKEELRKAFDGDDPEKSLKDFLKTESDRNRRFLFLVDEPAWKMRQDSAGASVGGRKPRSQSRTSYVLAGAGRRGESRGAIHHCGE